MPRKNNSIRYKKRRYAKKAYRKRAKKGNFLSLSCKQLGGFPDRYYAKLRTCVTTSPYTFVTTTGTRSVAFALNGLLTPIGGGGIYTGFQNFLGQSTNTGNRQAIYINYCVHAIRVQVTVATNATSTGSVNPMLTIAVLPKGQTAGSNTITAFDWAEQPRSRHKTLTAGSTTDEMDTFNPLVWYANLHDIYGIKRSSDLHLLEGTCDGTVLANPTDTRYGIVAISTDSANNTDAALSYTPTIETTVWVEFYNRNMQFVS